MRWRMWFDEKNEEEVAREAFFKTVCCKRSCWSIFFYARLDEHLTVSTIEMLLEYIDVSSCFCSQEMPNLFPSAIRFFVFSFAEAARVGEYELGVLIWRTDGRYIIVSIEDIVSYLRTVAGFEQPLDKVERALRQFHRCKP